MILGSKRFGDKNETEMKTDHDTHEEVSFKGMEPAQLHH